LPENAIEIMALSWTPLGELTVFPQISPSGGEETCSFLRILSPFKTYLVIIIIPEKCPEILANFCPYKCWIKN